MRKLIRRIAALFITALMLFGAVGCGKVETPSFIKEYLCVEHTYGEGEITRSATCAREGRVKYECTECGHAKYEAIYSLDHTPYTVAAKAATCAEEGYTEHTACGVCGKVIEGKETVARLACNRANQTYAGLGLWDCSICNRQDILFPESVLSGTATSFAFNLWHRCYYKLENSEGYLVFKAKNILDPLGYITPESGMKIAITEIIIPFSQDYDWVAQGNIILKTNAGTKYANATDLLMAKGADYAEIKFKNGGSLSGNVISEAGSFTVTFSSGSYKISYQTSNSAKMVKINNWSTSLYGSTPLGV